MMMWPCIIKASDLFCIKAVKEEPGLLVKTPLNTARLEESTTGHNGLDAPLISDAMQCVSDRAGVID